MNKLCTAALSLTFLAVNSFAYANSTIDIPLPANAVIAAKSELKMNLNALTSEVPYVVTCTLDSTAPTGLDMSFMPHLAPKGGFGVTKLNDKDFTKNTTRLQNGKNTFTFVTSVTDKTKTNELIMKNLDDTYSSTVTSCQAAPAGNVTSETNKFGSGYFYVTNDLPLFLDIAVGNYYPTDYCIPPYYRLYVGVSSDNQDIEVLGTHY